MNPRNPHSPLRHLHTALWTGIVVPPAASLLVLTHFVLSTSWIDVASASDIPSFLLLFFMAAVPVGYIFGFVPALLAGAIYSGALTAIPTGHPHAALRAGVGAVCGGVTGGAWFHAVAGPSWFIFAVTQAFVMALIAIHRTVDPAGSNCHLQGNSPAFGAGADLGPSGGLSGQR